ncbi:MAG: hypothetical protein WBH84_02770 [Defluviitoga tunisiensis]|mgnify:CR=1 FL=1|jgi:hypothetical protein|uniref:Uncharacterized protein n=1 Tax=Defluviitoga tunisiensis TaxID=1006576 RepID=A0A0C7P0E6_DEFTU|nr:hypothetical protein [Defluviitoga tunisiensis]MDD3600602.1 hypothetical protein [Defluviitoga tunisiensis]MDY0378945.1 hypothetical protein [Defluviitoga tunisiensis]CEP77715.1 hypothetical protein DTL3_0388 [Defluviitoga tunisiensis]HHV02201.1 hypothetical protein [Defluviitoga tunisiensis]HOB55483.1 hypothetical protein [Defluviitoga tunisiensis]
MRKRSCIITNIVLLGWFFLDMVGLYFGELYLVTRSWKDDGIFFLIFLISLLLFIFKERVGRYILTIWLSIWLVTQFLSHELFTIIGGGEGKIRYFEGSIKLINSDILYIPDLYHIILHVLILIALVTTLLYSSSLKNKIYMTKS